MKNSSYIVTGAAGFIGSHLLAALNDRGITEIVAVDDLSDGDKFRNIVDREITEYLDRSEFLVRLRRGEFDRRPPAAVLHQGACSDTMEKDGRYVMDNNYRYSVELLDYAQRSGVPFLYASSAAVYGARGRNSAEPGARPLNVYGYSKLLFDQHVQRKLAAGADAQIVGFRYFNVYGPREWHKGRMASVVTQFAKQYRENGVIRLFQGSNGYGDGEQARDFVWIGDVVRANLHFLDHPAVSGIFDIGSGSARSFNDVAVSVLNTWRSRRGLPWLSLAQSRELRLIEYIEFPKELTCKYQAYTQADIQPLRTSGFTESLTGLDAGIQQWFAAMHAELEHGG